MSASTPSSTSAAGLFGLQLVVGLAAMLFVAQPRDGHGATLLVPLAPGAAAALPRLALDGRTALLGAGLWPGSLVVRRGPGAHAATLVRGVLALPIPAPLCTAPPPP